MMSLESTGSIVHSILFFFIKDLSRVSCRNYYPDLAVFYGLH